jgi:opacity protein-like surface antigen
MICVCLTSVQNADALGVEGQVGWGNDLDADRLRLGYFREDLNIFLHDGELFDVFIGAEHAQSEHQHLIRFSGDGSIGSFYTYNAATLGIHVKPFERRRVNPYLMLGALSGKVHYSAEANDSTVGILSLSRDKAWFTTYRAGLGLNIVVIGNLAIEVEADYTGGVPAAHATVTDRSGPVGNKSDRVMFDGSPIVTIAVGIRYTF